MTQLVTARSATAVAVVTNGPAANPALRPHMRVRVIGTGTSAVQIAPAIQPEVAAMTVFQRTPAGSSRGWTGTSPAPSSGGVLSQVMHRRRVRPIVQAVA